MGTDSICPEAVETRAISALHSLRYGHGMPWPYTPAYRWCATFAHRPCPLTSRELNSHLNSSYFNSRLADHVCGVHSVPTVPYFEVEDVPVDR